MHKEKGKMWQNYGNNRQSDNQTNRLHNQVSSKFITFSFFANVQIEKKMVTNDNLHCPW